MAIRLSKYLNNLVEQDRRNIKRRIRSWQGFKSFRRAQTILAGIELIHMIRKGQYHLRSNFIYWLPKKTDCADFDNYSPLLRHNRTG